MFAFLRRIVQMFRPYKLHTALLMLALLIDLAFETFMPLSFKFVIDFAIVPQNSANLLLILASLVSGAAVASLAGVFRDKLYASMGSSVMKDLHLKLFRHLQKLSMDFYSRTKAGDILARFNTDLTAIDNLIMLLPYGILSFIGLLFNVILLFILQWKLALFAVIGLPVCLVGPKLIGGRASDTSYRLKEEQAAVTASVQENIAAQPVIQAFGLQQPMIRSFTEQMLRYLKVSSSANYYTFLIDRTTNIGVIILNLIAICIGSILAFQGHLTIGSLLAFNAILLSISHLIGAVTWLAPQLVQAVAGLRRIDELLGEQPSVSDGTAMNAIPPLQNGISFRDVSFSYKTGQISLQKVTLDIPKGSYAAFVGVSGSGKSTIINLLMRFYDPTEGKLLFDGVDYREIRLDQLRGQIGIVFQENFLFDTSIRENIRMGKPGATDEEIEQAAKAAEIHDFILQLPEGYETHVGERGGRLSGGQRQRMAIARSLLRDPAILILDEATSALDPSTEAAINETLLQLAGTRTIVSVTHRLASAQHADRIYVLGQGRIIEEGTHDELLQLGNGAYKTSWQKQSGFSISDDGFNAEINPERLRSIPLLADMDLDFLEEISHYFVTESYGKNRPIIEEGDAGDKFYMIVRGQVEVLKKTASQDMEPVAVLSDGDFFGEIALLYNVPRSATVRSLTPVVCMTLQRGLFQRLINKAPHLRERLAIRERLQEQTAKAVPVSS
ncbi:ABC transporter transmembrane domain-containing protein [Paenibacillus sp. MBLB4367]|uniref:ABC transporter transmembrane domain-containing protein n=1 Tax=Paenibacillus sp. MBLB4367 TaxID=3384767 RepID=UPI003907FC03